MAMVGALALVATTAVGAALPAQAADPTDPTASMGITKSASTTDVTPGQTFSYTIEVTCSATGQGATGCVNFVLTDPLPQYIELAGTPTSNIPGATPTYDEATNTLTVDVNQDLGSGTTGMLSGRTLTVTIPVRLSPDAPASIDGTTLTNTATVTADNAAHKDGTANVTPQVEQSLAAGTTKEITPTGAAARPGTTAGVTLTGTNSSNVPVDSLTVQDPVDPTADPNPFDLLAVTNPLGGVTMPAGAEQVTVSAYVEGQGWVEGTPGPPPAVLPDGVEPTDVRGLRYEFTSTEGNGIEPGASASVPFTVEQREGVTDLTDPFTVTNDAQTTVGLGEGTATSDPADDTYVITPPDLHAAVTKSFSPDTVHAGDPSTVTIGATNTSNVAVDSLTITEPTGGTNPFEGENALTFTGFTDGVDWPAGATGATIVYTGPGCSGDDQSTTATNTLPDPPDGCAPTGFSVTFTGAIDAGAEATLPFTVDTDADQSADSLAHANEVGAQTAIGEATSDEATDDATLTTLADRLATETTKRITPNDVPALPGQDVTTGLTGTVKEFPDSTVNAQRVVIQDPEDPTATPNFFDTFRPTSVDSVEIPECAVLTVNYWDGDSWEAVPGMSDIAGPQRFSAQIPADIDAHGLQFVYTPAAGCDGFPPGTSLSPNFTSVVRPGVDNADATVSNCAGTDGSAPTVADPAHSQDCADVQLHEVEPGEGDLIDKTWDDPANVPERSGDERGATLHWSTGGFSNLDSVVVSDVADPTQPIQDSVFDAFDLVRIDPITAADDPHLKYDKVTSVELYVDGAWVEAADDPCPSSCDGTFPGYVLTDKERADATAFRLTFEESDTHRDGSVGTPGIGAGVARSSGNDRAIHPVFALRDTTRHEPEEPVLSTTDLNTDQAGVVDNVAQATGTFPDGSTVTDRDGDEITIVPTNLVVDLAKSWTGGPLAVPATGTPAGSYPSGRVTLKATNRSLSRLDTLTISEPTGDAAHDPFDTFNLSHFATITAPADLGATDVAVTVHFANGPDQTFTRERALGLTRDQLLDAVGFDVVYTGRIHSATDAADGGPTNVASVTFDTQLRATHRDDDTPMTAPATVDNQATTTGRDLVDFPGAIREASDSDTASIDLVNGSLDVRAEKSFDPASQTEGDDSPVTVTLTGQPLGPARTVSMVVTDYSPTFWNQYDFTGFAGFSFAGWINRVQVDAYTGGTWSVGDDGDPVLTGGSWKTGVAASTPALPGGVTAGQVQGLRFTYTRADGANWENPATPTQRVSFQVTRRATLNTGGPVQTDQAGHTPAPGETQAGRATDDITVDATSSAVDANGDPITAAADATAHIDYVHLTNAVQVVKTPNGDTEQPGQAFPYTLTVKNTGAAPISNPVITDTLPTDAQGAQLVFDPDTEAADRYAYTLAPDSSAADAMPVDPTQVAVDETDDAASRPTALTFTFPSGTTLQPGETYTITFKMVVRTGLAADTKFTNEFGITSDRPWDECDGTLTEDGACTAEATNTVAAGGAITMTKLVKADDSDSGANLGITTDPATSADPAACKPVLDGFYARPCVPVTAPGDDITWRLGYTNSGNLPMDIVEGGDLLPAVGDHLALDPAVKRGSQWAPVLTGARPTSAGAFDPTVANLVIEYTTDPTPCFTDIVNGQPVPCGDDWVEWPEGTTLQDLGVDPADVTGIRAAVQYLGDNRLMPGQSIGLDVPMRAPALTPGTGATSYAYNTVAGTGRAVYPDGHTQFTLPKEPARVGVALATGSIRIVKKVTGPGAGFAPSSFPVTVECTSVGVDVPLGDAAHQTLTPDQEVTVDGIPYGSDCTVSEGDNGQTGVEVNHVTATNDPLAIPLVTVTNDYELASLDVTKSVDSSAVDQDGTPVAYGPFHVTVDCTFLGDPVYADGYDADHPMEGTIADGDTLHLEGLPAGADCTVTEDDAHGAVTTTHHVTPAGGDESTADGDSATVELEPTTDGTNTDVVHNAFSDGSLRIVKHVEGDAADTYGAGPFTVHVECTLDDESGTRTTWSGDVTLGGDDPLTHTIEHVATGSSCVVTETDDGGATSTSVSPDEPVVVGSGEDVAEVTVTNTFDPGVLHLTKDVTGDAADFAAASFQAEVTCTADGETLAGFPQTVTVTPGETTSVDALVGAECRVKETDTHAATGVTYAPADDGDPSQSGAVTVGPADEDPVTIGITNEYRAGGLQVAKLVDGPGAPEASVGPFVFDVTCSFDGDDAAFQQTVTLEGDGTTSELESDVLGPLPVGAVCVVRETDDGGADSTPAPVTVTIPDVDDDGNMQVVVAGLVNPFSAGTISLTKKLTGDGVAAAVKKKTFTVQLTCQYDAGGDGPLTLFSDSVKIKGGETLTAEDADGNPVKLPLGTRCFATETKDGGADASTVDHGTVADAAVVGISDELQPLEITVTNRFDPATPGKPGTPGGPGGSGTTTPPLAATGAPLAQVALAALALLGLGLGLVLLRRRREG
ncbi:hypothetical protein GCM10023221_22280 [Luteimicrobium xylanilyticum]